MSKYQKGDGQIQTEWRWLLAIYLFLGGVGAGAYAISAAGLLKGGLGAPLTNTGLYFGFPLLLIGSLFLMADLGAPSRAFRVAAKPGASWISRGVMIITLFMAVSFIHFIGQVWPYDFLVKDASGVSTTVISVVGIVLAIFTMLYTGALLSAAKGIALWSTGIVPALFLVSALVTGLFGIMVGMPIIYGEQIALNQVRFLALAAAGLVFVELLVIFFFMHSAYNLPDSKVSATRLLKKPLFIYGDLILGLLVPLLLMLVVFFGMKDASRELTIGVAVVGASLGLIGGVLLRFSILSVGSFATLNASGFEFRRVARPKEPMPGVGLLPPG